MSSGTHPDPNAGRNVIDKVAASGQVMGDEKRRKLSKRQKRLAKLWSYFRVEEYLSRKHDWSGDRVIDRDAINHGPDQIPPGFEDAGGSMVPLKDRRPTSPLGLVRSIVTRFTGLLFSNKRNPHVSIAGDEDTEYFVTELLKHGRFWPTMVRARNYGGSMGSACVGFKFTDGEVVFEAFDPRWCFPKFLDADKRVLTAVEVRYSYPKEVRDEEGGWKEETYWYRRLIDERMDRIWVDVPDEGGEPAWENIASEGQMHNLGFVPAEWIQNIVVDDDIDGDPDCQGCYDLVEAIDALLSQAHYGVLLNCLGAETPFITSQGVRTFAECTDGEEMQVLTHAGHWKPAVSRSYGRQQLNTIRFGRGANSQTVRATANHRWVLEDGSVTSALKVGDKLWKPPHLIRDWCYEESPELQQIWWTRGFAYGDGSVRRTDGKVYGTQVRLCGAKKRFLGRFLTHGGTATYPPSCDGEPMVYMRKYAKERPSLEDESFENVMAFVRGYLDADGSRALKHQGTAEISPFQGISVTGDDEVAWVRSVFPMVGAYIVNEDDRTHQITAYGKYTATTVYFSLVLGFSNSPVAPYIVRSIKPGRVETVWCLEVEDDQSFVLPCGITTKNCDPTLFMSTTDEVPEVKKGSDNAIKLTNGQASYLEINGMGPKTAQEMAKLLEERVYRLAACVPESVMFGQGTERTATEIERAVGTMLEKADMLREQYGVLVTRIINKLIRAVRHLTTPMRDPESGTLVRGTITLPPKPVTTVVEGKPVTTYEQPRLGPGRHASLRWGRYFPPTLTDIETAIRSFTTARDSTALDDDNMLRILAPYYGDDIDWRQIKAAMAAKVEADAAAELAAEPEDTGPPPPEKLNIQALIAGAITINEYRESYGLGAMPDGEKTFLQLKSEHPEFFTAAAMAGSKQAIDAMMQDVQAAAGPEEALPPESSPPEGEEPAPAPKKAKAPKEEAAA